MMALVKLGPLVQSIVGTLGSVTFRGGGAAGIATPRQRKPTSQTIAQAETRRILAHHAAIWSQTTNARRELWRQYAASLTWTNRMGVAKHPTAREAFLYAAALADPNGDYQFGTWAPQLGGQCITPIVASLSFTAGDACNVVTTNYPGAEVIEIPELVFPLQYGPRRSGAQRHRLDGMIRSSNTLDWSTPIAAAGLTLTAGDLVEVRFWWRSVNTDFSQRTTAQTTVL